jgi:hypothetical protein
LNRDRLPHKSFFTAHWDAETTTWKGRLCVHHDGKDFEFTAAARGIIRMLERLDDQWRLVLAGALAIGGKAAMPPTT